MLKYECPKCGAIKEPDGKGCQCGESYGALRVINTEDAQNTVEKK
jgi:hypothetical protein